ncbi:pentapeptide repeat-containing protein [Micromonospora radicis]|nr:pentapeptide repeat-containing protein [Micromonospora radicis]
MRRVAKFTKLSAAASLITLLAGAAVLLFLLLGPIAWWATPAKHLAGKDKADARNNTRQVLLAGVGGIGLLVGASFTARTYFLARRGQVTERYGKAVAQLSSEKLVERLGGIYALEHVMADSVTHHETVCSVLAAFVREEARGEAGGDAGDRVATDVEAAVVVLGRRPRRREQTLVDLTGARLTGADLTGADLEGAVLGTSAADLRADLRPGASPYGRRPERLRQRVAPAGAAANGRGRAEDRHRRHGTEIRKSPSSDGHLPQQSGPGDPRSRPS